MEEYIEKNVERIVEETKDYTLSDQGFIFRKLVFEFSLLALDRSDIEFAVIGFSNNNK